MNQAKWETVLKTADKQTGNHLESPMEEKVLHIVSLTRF